MWGVLALAALQLLLSTRAFIASHLANTDDPSRLRLAVRFAPDNAEYLYRLKHFAFVENDPTARSAVLQVSGRPQSSQCALLAGPGRRISSQRRHRRPTTSSRKCCPRQSDQPRRGLGSRQLLPRAGRKRPAFRQFRVVLENQPNMALLALRLCWRVSPDVDALLSTVVPPSTEANIAFLQLLMSQKDPQGAAKVWRRLIDLHQPFETRYLFQYLKFLIAEQQVDQARIAWQQGAPLLGLSAYLPRAT